MNILRKIQNQPKYVRKIILWLAVIILGTSLLILWIRNLNQRLKTFQREEFIKELKLPPLGKELKGVPKIEMPKVEGEELKKLEQQLKEMEE